MHEFYCCMVQGRRPAIQLGRIHWLLGTTDIKQLRQKPIIYSLSHPNQSMTFLLFLFLSVSCLTANSKHHELYSALKVKMNAGVSLLQTPQSNATASIQFSSSEEEKDKVVQELLALEIEKNKQQQQLQLLQEQTSKVDKSLKAARRELTATLVEKNRAQKEMTGNDKKTNDESNVEKCPPTTAATVCEVCKEEEPLPFLSHDALTFVCVALLLCFLGAISFNQTSNQKIKKYEKKILVMKTAQEETQKLRAQLEELQQSKGTQRAAVSPVPGSPILDHQEKLDALNDTIKSLKRQLKAVKEEAEMSEQRIDELQLELKLLKGDREVMMAKQVTMETLLRVGTNQNQHQADVAVERAAHIAELYTLSAELEAARTETDIANGKIQQTQSVAKHKKNKA